MFGIKIGEKESKRSISGKDLKLSNDRDVLYLRDLGEEEIYKGNPIVSIFRNDDKTYNNVSIRLLNEYENEELRLSVNYPKKDCPLIRDINKDFGFYLNAFNLVRDIAILTGVDGVDDETISFKEVNFKELLEYIDGLDEMGVQMYIPDNSEYLSFRVVKTL